MLNQTVTVGVRFHHRNQFTGGGQFTQTLQVVSQSAAVNQNSCRLHLYSFFSGSAHQCKTSLNRYDRSMLFHIQGWVYKRQDDIGFSAMTKIKFVFFFLLIAGITPAATGACPVQTPDGVADKFYSTYVFSDTALRVKKTSWHFFRITSPPRFINLLLARMTEINATTPLIPRPNLLLVTGLFSRLILRIVTMRNLMA